MATQIVSESNIYEPSWNEEEKQYEDIELYEKYKKGPTYICPCRSMNDEFSSRTEQNAHIKNKYHKNWVIKYGKHLNEDNKRLKEENDRLKRDIAIQSIKFDKQISNLKRQLVLSVKEIDILKKSNTSKETDEFVDCD